MSSEVLFSNPILVQGVKRENGKSGEFVPLFQSLVCSSNYHFESIGVNEESFPKSVTRESVAHAGLIPLSRPSSP